MPRILLPFSAALAACTPSPQDAAMRSSSLVQGTTVRGSGEASRNSQDLVAPNLTAPDARGPAQAAQAPVPAAVSVAENLAVPMPADPPAVPSAAPPTDSPAEARGRKTLSTAFVRIGPDGHLTVELRGGHVVVLRDVVLRARKYCGMPVMGGPREGTSAGQYCGGYADVVAARPGGAPTTDAPTTDAPTPMIADPGTPAPGAAKGA